MKYLLVFLCLICIHFYAPGQVSRRQIAIGKEDRFLSFPVSMKDTLRKMQILFEGKVIDEFTIHLSTGEPEYWTFFDVSPYLGRSLRIQMEGNDSLQQGFNRIFSGRRFPGEDSLYAERLRPQVHFTSRRGWNNDPNGLVFAHGVYHLFYQHNPYGTNWGNMHWGHAVSKDLLHWKEQPGEAWYTPHANDMAFSGSAIVDSMNTSGFRKDGIDPILAFYTSTGRGECIALSYDNGRTFQDYPGNPIIKHAGRDPKVFWFAPGRHWVMAVYEESYRMGEGSDLETAVRGIAIYTSPDLRNWTYQSTVPGFYECPNLFQLPLEQDTTIKKWVIYGGSGKYKVGDFDGNKFVVEQDLRDYDYGRTSYASQIYSNIPSQDGRQVQIAWARIGTRGMPFNQCMGFPVELKLRRHHHTYLLCPSPVEEIRSIYNVSHFYDHIVMDERHSSIPIPDRGDVLDVVATFEAGGSRQFGLSINGYKITYDNVQQALNGITYPWQGGAFKIEAIVDKSILEIFINGGELYLVRPLDPDSAPQEIKVFSTGLTGGHKTVVNELEVHTLTSIW